MKTLLILFLLLIGCTSTKPKEYVCIGGKQFTSKKGWAITYTGISCEIKCEVRK